MPAMYSEADAGSIQGAKMCCMNSTASAAIELCRRLGAQVLGAAFVIDLPELGGRRVIEALGVEEAAGGVAYMAHIGGFVAGVLAGFVFRMLFNEPRHPRGTPASLYR